jgi:hypothetical protein
MVLGLGALTAGFLSARAAINSLRTSFVELDKIGKISDRLGLGVEELQKMRFAGELTGVSIQTMDMALQRWTKNTAKAAAGSKELSKVFEKDLGLSAKELIKLPLEEQMKRFADALDAIPNQADRVRVAAQLLDSEGVALIQTLQGGSEALDDLFKQAREAGIFSEADIARIEEANDAMTRLTQTWQFLKGQIAVGISPAIKGLSDDLRELGINGENAGALVNSAFETFRRTLTKGRIGLLELQQTFAELAGDASLLDATNDELRRQEQILRDIGKEEKKREGRKPPPDPVTDPTNLLRAAALQPAAFERGSLEAFSAIQGAARKDRLSELVAAAQAQAEEDRKANEHLASIDKKTVPVTAAAL